MSLGTDAHTVKERQAAAHGSGIPVDIRSGGRQRSLRLPKPDPRIHPDLRKGFAFAYQGITTAALVVPVDTPRPGATAQVSSESGAGRC